MISKAYCPIIVKYSNFNELLYERIHLPKDIKNSVLRRKCEFLAGRKCVKLAYDLLGISDLSLPAIGQYREPIWPSNINGSITHNKDKAAAIISNRNSIYLGIDIESWFSPEFVSRITKYVLTQNELLMLTKSPNSIKFVTTIFSAKESIYKCLFSIKKLNFNPKLFNLIKFDRNYLIFSISESLQAFEPIYPETIKVSYKIYKYNTETIAIYNSI